MASELGTADVEQRARRRGVYVLGSADLATEATKFQTLNKNIQRHKTVFMLQVRGKWSRVTIISTEGDRLKLETGQRETQKTGKDSLAAEPRCTGWANPPAGAANDAELRQASLMAALEIVTHFVQQTSPITSAELKARAELSSKEALKMLALTRPDVQAAWAVFLKDRRPSIRIADELKYTVGLPEEAEVDEPEPDEEEEDPEAFEANEQQEQEQSESEEEEEDPEAFEANEQQEQEQSEPDEEEEEPQDPEAFEANDSDASGAAPSGGGSPRRTAGSPGPDMQGQWRISKLLLAFPRLVTVLGRGMTSPQQSRAFVARAAAAVARAAAAITAFCKRHWKTILMAGLLFAIGTNLNHYVNRQNGLSPYEETPPMAAFPHETLHAPPSHADPPSSAPSPPKSTAEPDLSDPSEADGPGDEAGEPGAGGPEHEEAAATPASLTLSSGGRAPTSNLASSAWEATTVSGTTAGDDEVDEAQGTMVADVIVGFWVTTATLAAAAASLHLLMSIPRIVGRLLAGLRSRCATAASGDSAILNESSVAVHSSSAGPVAAAAQQDEPELTADEQQPAAAQPSTAALEVQPTAGIQEDSTASAQEQAEGATRETQAKLATQPAAQGPEAQPDGGAPEPAAAVATAVAPAQPDGQQQPGADAPQQPAAAAEAHSSGGFSTDSQDAAAADVSASSAAANDQGGDVEQAAAAGEDLWGSWEEWRMGGPRRAVLQGQATATPAPQAAGTGAAPFSAASCLGAATHDGRLRLAGQQEAPTPIPPLEHAAPEGSVDEEVQPAASSVVQPGQVSCTTPAASAGLGATGQVVKAIVPDEEHGPHEEALNATPAKDATPTRDLEASFAAASSSVGQDATPMQATPQQAQEPSEELDGSGGQPEALPDYLTPVSVMPTPEERAPVPLPNDAPAIPRQAAPSHPHLLQKAGAPSLPQHTEDKARRDAKQPALEAWHIARRQQRKAEQAASPAAAQQPTAGGAHAASAPPGQQTTEQRGQEAIQESRNDLRRRRKADEAASSTKAAAGEATLAAVQSAQVQHAAALALPPLAPSVLPEAGSRTPSQRLPAAFSSGLPPSTAFSTPHGLGAPAGRGAVQQPTSPPGPASAGGSPAWLHTPGTVGLTRFSHTPAPAQGPQEGAHGGQGPAQDPPSFSQAGQQGGGPRGSEGGREGRQDPSSSLRGGRGTT